MSVLTMNTGTRQLTLLVAIAAVALAGCTQPPEPAQNLIVISIDTLRPDHLGCYGYERPTSPFIDTIAAEGVLFEDASAPSPWTKPSHASLLTGLYPRRNGAASMESVLSPDVTHLASWLAASPFQVACQVLKETDSSMKTAGSRER